MKLILSRDPVDPEIVRLETDTVDVRGVKRRILWVVVHQDFVSELDANTTGDVREIYGDLAEGREVVVELKLVQS